MRHVQQVVQLLIICIKSAPEGLNSIHVLWEACPQTLVVQWSAPITLLRCAGHCAIVQPDHFKSGGYTALRGTLVLKSVVRQRLVSWQTRITAITNIERLLLDARYG